ncbi:hypothetical protein Rs2_43219 [Raphanus sativus]|uniref:Uncharacterized protein LOC108826957 n=1 Tax=Raphanus sativus TaxID=3726 RepID=A0A6J0L7H7_RAPSA|nr:uncharacterized protein LOC108826957 [Raphanus sativus]KAJ4878201.1 hypothetical protein Rs2_43219 [Raphanus sativus]
MDPCTFVRITVGNLVVRASPSVSEAAPGNWFCKIKLKSFPRQVVAVPVLFRTESESQSRLCSGDASAVAARFTLSKAQIEWSILKPERSVLSVEVYSPVPSCGLLVPSLGEKLIGRFKVSLDLKTAETRTCLAHHGWVELGANNKKNPELHVSVRVEPDRRFMFEFDREPECSPKIFLIHGNMKQAVFTCTFGIRNSPSLTRSLSLTTGKKHTWRGRKGWSITIHDLSGSPVAMASIATPFVPSPGSKRVSKSSPGAWLILRPDGYIMKPWGRLEAWRESGRSSDVLGYRFHLFQDDIATEVSTSSSIRTKLGGSFVIDGNIAAADVNTAASLTLSDGSFDLSLSTGSFKTRSGCGSDFGFLLPQAQQSLGFVMSTRVEAVEKHSRPKVEVGEKYVKCVEDAAAHVALAAAVDLSMDACRLFSHKIRKELR